MNPDNQENSEAIGKKSNMTRREFLKLTAATLGAFVFNPETLGLDKGDDSFTDVAKSYIAKDPKEAEEVSKRIRSDRSASASNVCGPLATSILLGWRLNEDGTVSNRGTNRERMVRMEGVSPNDLWLGSPENDPNRYRIAFPDTHYDSYHIKESIGTLDFNRVPGVGTLEPGDFLYLDGGSFTHYIAISRRDFEGRIYCVSNIHSSKPQEFIIDEVMLWDPKEKNGFFRDWAKGVGVERARTGLKGFYLWRRKKEAEYLVEDPYTIVYRDFLTNEMRKEKKGNWNVNIFEPGMGQIFEWRNSVPFRSETGVNIPLTIVALNLIKAAYSEDINKEGLETVIKRMGYEGKSFEQLISSTLVNSDRESAELLARFCRSKSDLQKEYKQIGLNSTVYESKRTSQKDIYTYWRNLFVGDKIDRDSADYILKQLEATISSGPGILSEVRKEFPAARLWSTKSFVGGDYTSIQESGVVVIPQGNVNRYIFLGISGVSRGPGSLQYSDGMALSSLYPPIIARYVKDTEKIVKRKIENRFDR